MHGSFHVSSRARIFFSVAMAAALYWNPIFVCESTMHY